MRILNAFFTERENDGLVGRTSMRLGKLVKDDCEDHLDMVKSGCWVMGLVKILLLFTNHAEFLASKRL